MSTDHTKTPWKNGFYYSDKNTAELKKFNGNTAEIYSIGMLVYDLDIQGNIRKNVQNCLPLLLLIFLTTQEHFYAYSS